MRMPARIVPGSGGKQLGLCSLRKLIPDRQRTYSFAASCVNRICQRGCNGGQAGLTYPHPAVCRSQLGRANAYGSPTARRRFESPRNCRNSSPQPGQRPSLGFSHADDVPQIPKKRHLRITVKAVGSSVEGEGSVAILVYFGRFSKTSFATGSAEKAFGQPT